MSEDAVVVVGELPTGFCGTGCHERCPGSLKNKGGKERWMCPCQCHGVGHWSKKSKIKK